MSNQEKTRKLKKKRKKVKKERKQENMHKTKLFQLSWH